MKSALLFLLAISPLLLFAQPVTAVAEFDRMATADELDYYAGLGESQMMCTAVPPLAILNCEADDRTDPFNNVPPGVIRWRVEGGANPVTCRLIAASGPIYNIVGGGGPFGNQYNSPRDFSVNNTTTSNTCIVIGMYTIEVTDALGCVQTCQVNFVPTCFDYASNVSPTITQAICNSATGCIDLGNIPDAYCPDDPTAGNVSYSWSNGAPNSPSICNLAPGFYSVTMTDFYGCEGIINNIEVTSSSGVEVSNCGGQNPTLIGGSDGQVFFNISSGTPGFTVNWSGAGNSGSQPGSSGPNTINGLVEGNYTVTVVDAQGCTDECTVFIENPNCTFNVNCPSGPNANNSVTITTSGGVGPYSVTYTGPSSGSSPITGNSYTSPVLSNGNYTFTVRDANGATCQQVCTVTIFAPDCSTLVLSDQQITDVSCAGSLDGAIDITLGGGYPNFDFSWTGPGAFTATTEDISGLAPGTYTLNVDDSEGCELDGLTFTIAQPDALMIDCSATASDFGLNNGSVSVAITGGTPPYDLDLNGSVTNNYVSGTPITNLPPNTYNIVVTDANGCTENCTVAVLEVQCDINYTVDTIAPSCPGAADGSISITIFDAMGDTTIVWSVAGNDGQTSINGLTAGTYTVTVGDTACVLATQTIVLNDPAPLALDLTQTVQIDCHGDATAAIDTTIINGVPPFTFGWNQAGPVSGLDALAAGTYEITVTDANGCTAADTIIIDQPADLVLNCSSTNETASGLNDGTIALDFTGAAPFTIAGDLDSTNLQLIDAPINLTGLAPGTYNYTITDVNGCTENCSVIVDPGGCIMTVSLSTTQPDCITPMTGSISATVSNGTAPLTYQWTPTLGNFPNPANLMPGTYDLLVTDANGCSATASTTIIEYTSFPDVVVTTPDSICAGDCLPATLSLSGVAPFDVDYALVSNIDGMSYPATVTGIMVTDTTISICLTDFPVPPLTQLSDYNLNFLFIDDFNCGSTLTDDIEINHFILATDTIRQTYCEDDIVTIAGQNFDQFNPAGEITLTDQSVNGCDSLLVVDLTFVAAINSSVDTMLCPGNSLVLEGNVFDETNPTGSFTSAQPSALGCDSIVSVNLTFFAPATGTFNTTICQNGQFDFQGTIFDAANPTGDVVLSGASVNGCDSTVTVTVDFFAPATGTFNTTICQDGQFDFQGTIFDAANPTGDVVLSGASVNGCDSTVTVTVDFFAPATGTFSTTICQNDQFDFQGTIFDAANPTGDVVLSGASVNGCDSTVTVTVDFFAPATGTFNTTICQNDQFDFQGTIFDATNPTGDVVLSGASVNGCDSTVTVTVDFFAPATGTFNTTICQDGQFDFQGTIFDATNPTGDVVLSGASVNGCDSTVTVTVDFFAPATGTFSTTICQDDQFDFQGTIFDAANPTGDVVLSGASVNGCDSTVTVTVDFFAPATGTFSTTICQDDQFDFQGTIFDAANPTGDVVLANASINGCDSTVTVTVDFFAPATGTFSTTICQNDQFDFQGTIFDATNPTGDVVLSGASVNGCDSTVTVTVDFFAPATGTFNTTICQDDQFDFQGTIFDAANPTGDVVLSGASVNGCDSIVTVTVDFFAPATGTFSTTICQDDQFDFQGTIFDAANPTGDVVLSGASVNGCDSTVTVTVDFFAPATGTFSTTICQDDQFDFQGTIFDATNPTGDVVLSGASVNGCDSIVTVTVDFFAPATGTFSTTICQDGQFDFQGTIFDAANPTGDVVLANASVNGCDSTVTVTVDFFAPATGTFSTTICQDDQFDFQGTIFDAANPTGDVVLANASVNGCDSTVTVTVDFFEPISVTLSELEGSCADEEFTLVFDYNGQGPLELTLSNTTLNNYQLPAGSNTLVVTPLGPGSIELVAANAPNESCQLAFAGTVDIPAQPSLTLSILSGDGDNAISCPGGNDGHLLVEISGASGLDDYTFNWDHGPTGPELTGLTSGTYGVTASNPAGCSVSELIVLNEPLPLLVEAAVEEGDCLGNPPGVRLDTIRGGSGGPFVFRLDEGPFIPVNSFPLSVGHVPGTATLEVQDINGCPVLEELILLPPPVAEVVINPAEPMIMLGDSILLTAQTNLLVDTFFWSPGINSLATLPRLGYFARPTENTDYSITVTDSSGCTATATVTVVVDRRVPVFVPTGFSPNGDGANDVFTFFGDRGIVDFENFRIVDRWGNVVHEANGSLPKGDPSWGWDGNVRGEAVNSGVFVYQIYVNLEDGRRELLSGDITLVR